MIQMPFSKEARTKEEKKEEKLCPFKHIVLTLPPKIAGGPPGFQWNPLPCPQHVGTCSLWINGVCVRIEAYKRQSGNVQPIVH